MARQTHDREDLFRDGTQMPIRGRTLIGEIEVVVGFRSGGSASLYWDQDPVYQFNAGSELRRVYFGGVRFSAEGHSLLRLGSSRVDPPPRDSQRVAQHLKLSRQSLANKESSEVLDHLQSCLSQLVDNLVQNDASTWQSKGETATAFHHRLQRWIATIKTPCVIAQGPAVTRAPAN